MPTYAINPALRIEDEPGRVRIFLSDGEPPWVVDDPVVTRAVSRLSTVDGYLDAPTLHRVIVNAAGSERAGDLLAFLLDNRFVLDFAGRARSGYHLATRAYPFMDMSSGYDALKADNELMREYEADPAFPYPSPYLDVSGGEPVDLYRADDLDEPALWLGRRYHLDFLLHGVFGVRRVSVPYYDPDYDYLQSELVGKSVPSGGSRHPTEAFVVVSGSTGWRHTPGLYHYSTRRNALVPLDQAVRHPGDIDDRLADLGPPSGGEVAVWILYASAVLRAMWRYRDPRSMRALLVDVGHAEGQLATFAGLLGWRYAAFRRILRDVPALSERAATPDALPLLRVGLLEAR